MIRSLRKSFDWAGRSDRLNVPTVNERPVYILDTDHIGIMQRAAGSEYNALSTRIAQHVQTDLFVSIVSFHEQIRGWDQRGLLGTQHLEWVKWGIEPTGVLLPGRKRLL